MPASPALRRSGRERIELKDLRNLVIVAEELNITRAAHRLGMQQSPLSRSLQRLQAEVGCKLLDTTGKRVSLTREGQHMATEARRVLQHVADLSVRTRGTSEVARIRLDFTFSAGGQLPRLLAHNQAQERPAVLTLSPVSADDPAPVYGQVLIAPARLPQPGINQHPLWDEPLLAAILPDTRLANLTQVLLSELSQAGMIYLPADLASVLDPMPRRIRFREVAYVDVPTVTSLLIAGHCSVLVPSSLCPAFEQAGLLLKPVADLPPATICAHVAESSDTSVMHWVKHMASVLGAAATP